MSTLPQDGAAAAANAQARDKGMVDLDDAAANALITGFADDEDALPVELPEASHEPETVDPPAPAQQTEVEPPDSSDPESPESASKPEPENEEDPDELIIVELDETGAPREPRRAKEIPEDVDESKLSPEEARRVWQSRATKAEQAVIAVQAQMAALEAKLNAPANTTNTPADTPASIEPPITFDKKVTDFLEDGEEYDPRDGMDTETPSGRAYVKWMSARESYLVDKTRAGILGELDTRQQKVQADERLKRQVTTLRKRRPDAYTDDVAVQSLLQWASENRDDGLYLLAMAKDFSEGKLPLKRSTLQQLAKVYAPNAGNSNGNNAATISDAAVTPSSPDENDQQLAGWFDDGINASL